MCGNGKPAEAKEQLAGICLLLPTSEWETQAPENPWSVVPTQTLYGSAPSQREKDTLKMGPELERDNLSLNQEPEKSPQTLKLGPKEWTKLLGSKHAKIRVKKVKKEPKKEAQFGPWIRVISVPAPQTSQSLSKEN